MNGVFNQAAVARKFIAIVVQDAVIIIVQPGIGLPVTLFKGMP
jgi:hypothetical protein